MKRQGFSRCISVILTLCMILSCVSFSFATAGAATVDSSDSAVSATVTASNDFSWDNATVYFLLTDRFKNGNTSNDHSYNRGLDANGNVVSGIDTRGTFHGGDFAGITQTIEDGYFEDLGVNALWISAPYEQLHGYVVGGDSSPSFAHYSYHGYYVLDYTQTDANFGTAEEFETLVDTAHEHGLRVIIDIVLNHAGYNTIYDMAEYGYGTVKDGWQSSYFSHNNINNSTYHSYIDYDNNASDWAKWWGADWIRCGVAGYTAGGGDNYTMSLAGLPDFRTESTATVGVPAILQNKWTQEGRLSQETNELNSYFSKTGKSRTVTNTISYWLSTWVRDYGVDGFRCDTAKHVEYASWKALKDTCVDALEEWRANNPDKPGADWDEDFWMTGEHWDHGVYKDEYYTQGGFDSMINFSTQGGGLVAQGSVKNTYNGFASSINTDDSFNVLSYLSSHDSTLARGSLIPTGSAFLLLPGGVQIFYGDETNRPYVSGIPNDGNGGAGHSLRSDMNWDSIDESVLSHWQKVGTFRNNHIAVGAGANTDLTSTSGYAFSRTYSKNGVTDKVAACIYAGSNSNVTIDVSSLWADGQNLVNAYDQSSAVVTNGKVTFNSGANGTILIQEPDGRPLINVTGNAKFSGTQTVTVSLEECETAKCSIDGGNKFLVENGSTFTIGNTAYDGDTIKVVLEAENDKGTSKATFTFTKVAQGEDVTEPTTETTPVENAKIIVETWDGSAPYAYVWTGDSTAICGAWPGTKLTEKNSEGKYVLELDTTDTYSVVLNNGSGTQSGDLTGLSGTSELKVTNSSYSSTVVSTGNGGGGGGGEVTEDSVTIRVKTYDGSAPYLYVWNDDDTAINGAWPGSKLSEKDEDGNYIFVAQNTSSVNAIVNNGSGTQTSDITGLTGDVTITITNAEGTAYKLTENEVILSGMPLLKQEAREVKAMTASDYTASTWNTVNSLMTSVDALIVQGDAADETAVEEMIAQLQSAKAALKLAQPTLTYAVAGNSTISGIAVQDAEVKVTVGSNTYTAQSDDLTGEFVVSGVSLSSSSTIKVDVTRNDISSATYSYSMSNGNITNGEVPTTPTAPVVTTAPTTATTTTKATTAPTTTTQATTATTATEPTEGYEELTVTATSNLFSSATTTAALGETICVNFDLKSAMKLVNGQWKLTYDTSVLSLNTEKSSDYMLNVSNEVVNAKADGTLLGNFSDVNSLYDFTTSKQFVTLYFDVIGPGSTTVNLEVVELSVGYTSGGVTYFENAVASSQIVDITSISGYSSHSFTKKTTVTVVSDEDPTATTETQATTATQPTTDVADDDTLTVTAKSNAFPTATQTFNKDEGTVTVSYKLTSTMSVVDTQWSLTYDTTKLSLDMTKNMSDGVQNITPVAGGNLVYKLNDSGIKGNFTNLAMYTFKGDADFVSITFDIIGTGSTEVYLDLQTLSIGYKDSSSGETIDTSIIDYSEMIDVSGIEGFENASITTKTVLESGILMGDVNSDGVVNVNDVTEILKYVVDKVTLTAVEVKAADIDGDGIISVKDGTALQKILVQ